MKTETRRGQVFGLSIGELLGTYDPNSQSWKTSQLSLFEDLTPYWDRLPKYFIMLRGNVYQQPMWVRRTSGKESGLWPTPKKQNANGVGIHGQGGMDLQTVVQKFPTPSSSMMTIQDMEQARYAGNDLARPKYKDSFPTPQSRDWKGKSQRANFDENNRDCLPNVVGGNLNPQWVAWLMGYPLAWIDTMADLHLSLTRE